jgi:hypothetical protein
MHSAVVPVQTGIHTGCFIATTALDSRRVPQGEIRNDDGQIALTTMNQTDFLLQRAQISAPFGKYCVYGGDRLSPGLAGLGLSSPPSVAEGGTLYQEMPQRLPI